LFSTLWMKKQEESVVEIMEKCKNIKLGLGIWSSFDYFIWFQKRAPKIWRATGLEWLYRLITWPKKIDRLKRLYNAIFVFIYEIIKLK
jgi:N-acetylglucosaminyldiphosphoundecaprenol N-acetyl-beta-D-mannosaminyltransferase